jgi:hypothetical protein
LTFMATADDRASMWKTSILSAIPFSMIIRDEVGFVVARYTAAVLRYMPKRPPPAGSRQRWATFMRNHLHETLAIDFAVVPTATFGVLYVFFVLNLERRRVLHFNVTQHPTAEWTAQQVVEACPFDLPGRFLIRDNDKIYGTAFRDLCVLKSRPRAKISRTLGLWLVDVSLTYRGKASDIVSAPRSILGRGNPCSFGWISLLLNTGNTRLRTPKLGSSRCISPSGKANSPHFPVLSLQIRDLPSETSSLQTAPTATQSAFPETASQERGSG